MATSKARCSFLPMVPRKIARHNPKVRYFEAGKVHEAGEIFLHDEETLYMEGVPLSTPPSAL